MKTFQILLLATVITGFSACSGQPQEYYAGYAEADYVRLASPIAGSLAKIYLRRGDKAARDAPAFMLEQESERAARAEELSRVERAQALLANLKKGKRPEEIAAIRAQLSQAQAALQFSTADLERQKQLVAVKFVAPARVDEAQTAVARDRGRLRELQAQLQVAQLAARSDEIKAAAQDLRAAQAQLAQADWRLEQKTLRLPVAADVVDVLYREGEWVPAGSPVLSLLPPQNIKARFFVPQSVLGTLRLGQDVALRCDGCGAAIAAKISFISPQAEYTSPLIYSKENRSTLVFMIEAQPKSDDAQRLHPGQPLEVALAGPAAAGAR
jgi:HlyD family secretion protein